MSLPLTNAGHDAYECKGDWSLGTACGTCRRCKGTATTHIARLTERIREVERQNADLQAANNRLLERARVAERAAWLIYQMTDPKLVAAAVEAAQPRTCDGCKHWEKFNHGNSDELHLGSCERWLLRDPWAWTGDEVPEDGVVLQSDWLPGACMGPKFGCVLWEAAGS